jgi:hypothetical protein
MRVRSTWNREAQNPPATPNEGSEHIDVGKYQTGDPNSWAETPHPPNWNVPGEGYDQYGHPETRGDTWKDRKHPADGGGRSYDAADRYAAEERRKSAEAHAMRKSLEAVRIAECILPPPTGKTASETSVVAAYEEAIERTAAELLALPDESMMALSERLQTYRPMDWFRDAEEKDLPDFIKDKMKGKDKDKDDDKKDAAQDQDQGQQQEAAKDQDQGQQQEAGKQQGQQQQQQGQQQEAGKQQGQQQQQQGQQQQQQDQDQGQQAQAGGPVMGLGMQQPAQQQGMSYMDQMVQDQLAQDNMLEQGYMQDQGQQMGMGQQPAQQQMGMGMGQPQGCGGGGDYMNEFEFDESTIDAEIEQQLGGVDPLGLGGLGEAASPMQASSGMGGIDFSSLHMTPELAAAQRAAELRGDLPMGQVMQAAAVQASTPQVQVQSQQNEGVSRLGGVRTASTRPVNDLQVAQSLWKSDPVIPDPYQR